MNKRIIKLARQSGGIDMTRHADTTNRLDGDITTWIGTGTPEFLERFAELIVRECAGLFDRDEMELTLTESDIHNIIKEHFGVEE